MVGAQQKMKPVIGYLSAGAPGTAGPLLAGLRLGLGESGYVEGENLSIQYRWAEGQSDRLPALAAELVARKVDAIITGPGTDAARAAKSATATIPIVFIGGDDPVATGLVASLARPGGNVTGASAFVVELMSKRLELLRELVPQAAVIALLVNPNNSNTGSVIRETQEVARARGVQLQILRANNVSEIDAAMDSLVGGTSVTLVVQADQLFTSSYRDLIVTRAARHAVPAIYSSREYVTAGGLISYGTSIAPVYRQAGVYAGRILKGAKPADLPVMRPTTFEMVINLKTARALGLTVPPSILALADEVIER